MSVCRSVTFVHDDDLKRKCDYLHCLTKFETEYFPNKVINQTTDATDNRYVVNLCFVIRFTFLTLSHFAVSFSPQVFLSRINDT